MLLVVQLQRAPQRDRDRVDDLVARIVVGARQHGRDRAEEREQDHGLLLPAQQRRDPVVQVVDLVQDEIRVFHT